MTIKFNFTGYHGIFKESNGDRLSLSLSLYINIYVCCVYV